MMAACACGTPPLPWLASASSASTRRARRPPRRRGGPIDSRTSTPGGPAAELRVRYAPSRARLPIKRDTRTLAGRALLPYVVDHQGRPLRAGSCNRGRWSNPAAPIRKAPANAGSGCQEGELSRVDALIGRRALGDRKSPCAGPRRGVLLHRRCFELRRPSRVRRGLTAPAERRRIARTCALANDEAQMTAPLRWRGRARRWRPVSRAGCPRGARGSTPRQELRRMGASYDQEPRSTRSERSDPVFVQIVYPPAKTAVSFTNRRSLPHCGASAKR